MNGEEKKEELVNGIRSLKKSIPLVAHFSTEDCYNLPNSRSGLKIFKTMILIAANWINNQLTVDTSYSNLLKISQIYDLYLTDLKDFLPIDEEIFSFLLLSIFSANAEDLKKPSFSMVNKSVSGVKLKEKKVFSPEIFIYQYFSEGVRVIDETETELPIF